MESDDTSPMTITYVRLGRVIRKIAITITITMLPEITISLRLRLFDNDYDYIFNCIIGYARL